MAVFYSGKNPLSFSNYLLIGEKDSYTVPVVYRIRLFSITLPIYTDTAAINPVLFNQYISHSLGTFFGELPVIFRITCQFVGITNNLNFSIRILLQVFGCIVNTYVLMPIDLIRIDTEIYHIGNINCTHSHRFFNFGAFRTRFGSFAELFVFGTQSVDLTIKSLIRL